MSELQPQVESPAGANGAPPGRRSRKLLVCRLAALLLVAVLVLSGFVLNSAWFARHMRDKLVAELEQLTGGKVEIDALRWQLSHLEFDVSGLTIHGLEPPGEVPYAHVDRLNLKVRILSLLQRRISIADLRLERPVLHLIVSPDGRTNQPPLRLPRSGGGNPVQKLHELSLEKLEIERGEFLWNERRIPLDFSAKDFSLTGTYLANDGSYRAEISSGELLAKNGYGPLLATRAQVKAVLRIEGAMLESFSATGDHWHAEASGELQRWEQPKLHLQYKVGAQAAELARAARLPQPASGSLEASGTLSVAEGRASSSGKAVVKSLTWTLGTMKLKDLSGGLEFAADSERLQVPHLFASMAGGNLTGHAEIDNWRGAEKGSAELVLQRMLLRPALATLLPEDRLPALAGDLHGTVTIHWRGKLASADATAELLSSAPAVVRPDEISTSGRLRATYSGEQRTLRVTELNASGGSTRVDANGTLGERASNLNFALSTSNFAEVAPLLTHLRLPQPLPLELGGTATLTGVLTGPAAAPRIVGALEVRDFTTVLSQAAPPEQRVSTQAAPTLRTRLRSLLGLRPQPAPATDTPTNRSAPAAPASATAAVRLHWESLHADLAYSPAELALERARLVRGKTELQFSGTSKLSGRDALHGSNFELRGQIRNAELSDAQALAQTHYPLSGRLEASFTLRGSNGQIDGTGRLGFRDVTAWGRSIPSLDANLELRDRQLRVHDMTAVVPAGKLTGSGSYALSDRQFEFALQGAALSLERIPELQRPHFRLKGTVALDAKGWGTPETPGVEANLRASGLNVNGELLGELTAQAKTNKPAGAQRAITQLTVRSNFRNSSLALDGQAQMGGDWPVEAKLTARKLALDSLLSEFLPAGHPAHGNLDADLHLAGPARRPLALRASLDVPRIEGVMEGLQLHNTGPLRLRLEDGVVHVDQFRIQGPQEHYIDIQGTTELAGERRHNLQADGKVDLKLFQTLVPDLTTDGIADLSVRVRGTLGKPALRGALHIKDGAVSYVDLPNGLRNINGVLAFTQDRLQVQELTAVTGGGLLKLGGFVSYGDPLVFNLTAEGRDIRLRYPEGVSSSANANLAFSGSTGNALLSGTVTVTRLALNPQFDFSHYLSHRKQISLTSSGNTPANAVKLDLQVTSTPQLQLQSSLAQVTGNVDLRLRGTAARPLVYGRISVLEGNLSLAGTKYRLDRGEIGFSNPVMIDPNIDVEASTRVRDYDISLGLHGTMSRLSLTYRSDPPLPSSDIITLLALGSTREEESSPLPGGSQQAALSDSASDAILNQALNSAVNSRMQKLFGASRIKIDPNVGGSQTGANARLTMEQAVTDRVTITYVTNLAQSAQQIIQFQYYVTPRISIVGTRDQNGVASFNVFFRRRKN